MKRKRKTMESYAEYDVKEVTKLRSKVSIQEVKIKCLKKKNITLNWNVAAVEREYDRIIKELTDEIGTLKKKIEDCKMGVRPCCEEEAAMVDDTEEGDEAAMVDDTEEGDEAAMVDDTEEGETKETLITKEDVVIEAEVGGNVEAEVGGNVEAEVDVEEGERKESEMTKEEDVFEAEDGGNDDAEVGESKEAEMTKEESVFEAEVAPENLCRAIVLSTEKVYPIRTFSPTDLQVGLGKRTIKPKDPLTLSGKKGKKKLLKEQIGN